RSRAGRASGPPRVASERPPGQRSASTPPPSQRPRPSSPVVAAARPRPVASPSEPPTTRNPSSAAPRLPDAVSATLQQLPAVPEALAVTPVPEPAPAASEARKTPAAPTAAAWSKLLDDQGTAG